MRDDKHFTGLRPKIDGEMERGRIGAMQQWTWNKIPQIPKFRRRNAAGYTGPNGFFHNHNR
jgi:hypothetical protein